jgi:hypothetical protein
MEKTGGVDAGRNKNGLGRKGDAVWRIGKQGAKHNRPSANGSGESLVAGGGGPVVALRLGEQEVETNGRHLRLTSVSISGALT